MKMIEQTMRLLFFICIRIVMLVLLGMNIRRKQLLPTGGPAIIIANHNSHLDTLMLISLFPLRLLPSIHPAAAVDYFLRNPLMAWFSLKIIGIIPVARVKTSGKDNPLLPCYAALDRGEILILFPEGSRGEPEQMSDFKKGISFLAERYPDVPVIPVFMHGLGKALPKGDCVLVPFFCDIFVGEPLYFQESRAQFMALLHERFQGLAREGKFL
jgi:1-acyl-sn-glycerol-3-phosphate acyltransferase